MKIDDGGVKPGYAIRRPYISERKSTNTAYLRAFLPTMVHCIGSQSSRLSEGGQGVVVVVVQLNRPSGIVHAHYATPLAPKTNENSLNNLWDPAQYTMFYRLLGGRGPRTGCRVMATLKVRIDPQGGRSCAGPDDYCGVADIPTARILVGVREEVGGPSVLSLLSCVSAI
ncbi:hypothetical protein SUGI_0147900 [Cryptomeria japonica]|nr:hypothetical protein SUGI_0147900 [Cryptomeria japonica]